MLPLRYPWVWSTLGWLLVAGVVVGSLIPASSVPAVPASDKLLHAGVYALLMIWFSGLYSRTAHWLIALFLAVLGFGLDAAQAVTPTRSFDPYDVAANVGGILLGFVLARLVFEGWCRRVEQWLLT